MATVAAHFGVSRTLLYYHVKKAGGHRSKSQTNLAKRIQARQHRRLMRKLFGQSQRPVIETLADAWKLSAMRAARCRAKREGLPYQLHWHLLNLPSHCPVLGTTLNYSSVGLRADNSPSLDKIVPNLGYVTGNVLVISWRANRIKSDATPAELQALARFYN